MLKQILALAVSSTIAVAQQQFELYNSGFLRHGIEIMPPTGQELITLQYKCQYLTGLNIYDLQDLALAQPYYTFQDSVLNQYYVSFCNDIQSTAQQCSATTMVTEYPTAGECQVFSGSDPTKNAAFSVGNTDSNDDLLITYSGSSAKALDGSTNNIEIYIQCLSDTTQPLFVNPSVVIVSDTLTRLQFQSRVGCKHGQLSALWEWFNSNKWVMFAVFIAVGFLITFFGRTLFRPILFITGMLLSILLIWLIFYSTFLNSNTKQWVGWVVLASAAVIGLLIGFLFVKIVKLGVFALAAFGGYSLSLLLYTAFLYKMNSQVGFWCVTVGIALVCGILGIFLFEHVLIHATALLGSYMFVYGIGLVAGKYQNPWTIAYEMQEGLFTSIDPVFYAYLAGNIVLYALGALFQYRQKRNHHNNGGKDPYHRLRN